MAYVESLKRRGFTDAEIGSHAGLADTSLTLAPDLVRADRLKSSGELTGTNGVCGDPRRASAELGAAGVDIVVTRSVEALRKATAPR